MFHTFQYSVHGIQKLYFLRYHANIYIYIYIIQMKMKWGGIQDFVNDEYVCYELMITIWPMVQSSFIWCTYQSFNPKRDKYVIMWQYKCQTDDLSRWDILIWTNCTHSVALLHNYVLTSYTLLSKLTQIHFKTINCMF